MTISPKQQLLILVALGTIITGALTVTLFAQAIPVLHATRTKVDGKRARITVLKEQRSNILALQAEEKAIADAQQVVDQETWSFLTEDTFYTTLRDLFKTAGVRSEEPRLADATPSNQPLVRSGTIDMTGSRDSLLQALRLLRTVRPVIGITEIEYRGTEQSSVSVSITTLWQ